MKAGSELAAAQLAVERGRELERLAAERAAAEELGHQRRREAEALVEGLQRRVNKKEKQLDDVRHELRALRDQHDPARRGAALQELADAYRYAPDPEHREGIAAFLAKRKPDFR
jgi:hypothetical protein